jgi:MFS family permease
MSRTPLFIVYSLVVLYALCYQLQAPIEPFLVDRLLKGSGHSEVDENESARTYANLKTLFSGLQSFGSLAFGLILDRWGVRTGLVINFLACASCYYILSITDTIELLYFSRVPGLAMAGFLCAQTAVIKLTREGPERLVALGRLTSSYTIGGVIGPFIGGKLGATGDYFLGAKLACAGSLLAVALVFALPKSVDEGVNNNSEDNQQDKSGEESEEEEQSWFSRVKLVLSLVWLFLFVKIMTSVANSMAKSAQPVILKRLGIKEDGMGTVMSFQFAFGGFANAFLLGPITTFMGGHVSKVVRNSIITMGLIYVIQSIVYSEAGSYFLFDKATTVDSSASMMYPFIGMIMVLAIFQYSLGTAITSVTSELVPKKMQGTLVGTEHSLFAIAYMVGPQLGSIGLKAGGVSGLSAACAVFFGGVFLVFFTYYKGDKVKPM